MLVISRDTAFTYQGELVDTKQIDREPVGDGRTTSKRRVFRRRGECHAMLLSRRRREAANQIEGRTSSLVFSLRNGIAPPSRRSNAPWQG
jgi:hypothetical protein